MPTKKNQLKLFDNLICKNPNYNNFLAEEACKASNDQLLSKFANNFFAYLPVDYIAKDKDEICRRADARQKFLTQYFTL